MIYIVTGGVFPSPWIKDPFNATNIVHAKDKYEAESKFEGYWRLELDDDFCKFANIQVFEEIL